MNTQLNGSWNSLWLAGLLKVAGTDNSESLLSNELKFMWTHISSLGRSDETLHRRRQRRFVQFVVGRMTETNSTTRQEWDLLVEKYGGRSSSYKWTKNGRTERTSCVSSARRCWAWTPRERERAWQEGSRKSNNIFLVAKSEAISRSRNINLSRFQGKRKGCRRYPAAKQVPF